MRTFILCTVIVSLFCWIANIQPSPQEVKVVVVKDTVVVDPLRDIERAVATVESKRNPRAKRYEPVIFYRLTGQQAPTFDKAARINRKAAYMACSIGMHQILGMHYRRAGYQSLEEMIHADSLRQIQAFKHFIITCKYDKYIQDSAWDKFARAYNGPLYKRNHYAHKLLVELQ